jgi:hypothetical protein
MTFTVTSGSAASETDTFSISGSTLHFSSGNTFNGTGDYTKS